MVHHNDLLNLFLLTLNNNVYIITYSHSKTHPKNTFQDNMDCNHPLMNRQL